MNITFAENNLCNRQGKVVLPRKTVETSPQVVMFMCSQMVITQLSYCQSDKTFTYYGYSYGFDKVNPDDLAPEYRMMTKKNILKFVRS